MIRCIDIANFQEFTQAADSSLAWIWTVHEWACAMASVQNS